MGEPEFIFAMPAEAGMASFSFLSEKRCFVELADLNGLFPAVQYFTASHGARLITITCSDTPAFFELLHHMEVGGTVVTLRSRLWKPTTKAPSVAAANPAAELIEHEISELYGIEFEGNPRSDALMLAGERAKLTPLRSTVSQLEARIDGNLLTIAEHGSTTAPSRRVMGVRKQMGMPENPPLCSLKCPAKDVLFTIAEETGATSRHPKLKRGDAR